MFDASVIIAFLSASFLLCLAPGPDNLFVMANSLAYGKKAGLAITAGICGALILHTLAVALGLAVLFQESPKGFLILKTFGVAYLCYLAWMSFLAKSQQAEDLDKKTISPSFKSLSLRGSIMCLTNPKVLIFFLAFLPQFTVNQNQIAQQLLILGGLFVVTAAFVFSGFALLTGEIATRFNQSSQTQSILNKLAACVFLLMAINLAVSEL